MSSRHDTWLVHIYYVDQHQPEAYASKGTHSCSSLTALNASFISSTVPNALTRLSYMVCRQVAYSRIHSQQRCQQQQCTELVEKDGLRD